MARGEQIERQWGLLRALQTRGEGVPLAQLAEDFGVSERTIQRDFELLEELGFPVEHEDDEYGKRYWRLPHNFLKTAPLTLSLTEAISLHLAERMLGPLAGTVFMEGMQSLLGKIRTLLPQKAMDYFAGLSEILHVRPFAATDYSGHADAIKALEQAARERMTVQVDYRSLWRGETYTTLYDPYGLVLHLDDLFAVGRSQRANAIRIFKISRILKVEPMRKPFERPEDFDLEALFRNSFGIIQPKGKPVEVVVEFTGAAAAVVEERIWHDSQKLEWLAPEGSLFEPHPDQPEKLLVRFELAELTEFKRWVKGFGDQAVVLQPDWLRDELRQELAAAAGKYRA